MVKALITGFDKKRAKSADSSPCSWIKSSPTSATIASIFSRVSFTNTPTFFNEGDSCRPISAAFPGVIRRELSAKTNPIILAPARSTAKATSTDVMPQILTSITYSTCPKNTSENRTGTISDVNTQNHVNEKTFYYHCTYLDNIGT